MSGAAIVQGPLLTPPTVSLLAAAMVVDEVEDRWLNGVLLEAEGCGAVEVAGICDNDPTTGYQKTITGNGTSPLTGSPYAVIAHDSCSTFGFSSRDYRARATRMLLAVESFKIARVLWEGDAEVNQVFLSQAGLANTTNLTGLAGNKIIGALEEAFYATSPAPRAMIHMAPRTLERLMFDSGGQALRREGGVYYTWMDSVVAVDKGYRGRGPNGAAGEWIYITPLVQIRRSPIDIVPGQISEAVARKTNDITFFAERGAIATFDYNCQVYAASLNA